MEFSGEKFWIERADNLDFLKEISNDYIDLIYSDVLFGTGRNFGDYQDLKLDRKIIFNHYIPRFKEMHRVLKKTGNIFIQVDPKISHLLRNVLDDIFGFERYVDTITWKYNKFSTNKKSLARNKDVILWYSKSEKFTYNEIRIPLEKPRKQTKRVWNPNLQKAIQEKDENGNLIYYEAKDKAVDNVWLDIPNINPMAKERLGFATQKPIKLAERIIKMGSNEGDIVADFYLGSGTTAEAALKLKREILGCDIQEKAFEMSKQRIKKVIK